MERQQKEDFIRSFHDVAQKARLMVLTKQTGLSVKTMDELRQKLREQDACFRIGKNTLMKRALKGTHAEGLGEHLQGPTGIAYSQDPVAAAKAVASFAKDNDKTEVIAGCLDGQVLDKAGVMALATLPSLEVLRAQILGVITAPLQKVMGIVNAPGSSMARVIAARAAKNS